MTVIGFTWPVKNKKGGYCWLTIHILAFMGVAGREMKNRPLGLACPTQILGVASIHMTKEKLALMLLPFLCFCSSLRSQEFAFVKVVDTATPIPGQEEPFFIFGIPAMDDAGNIVFWGQGTAAGSGGGLYTLRAGDLITVADADVPIPGQPGTFAHGFRAYGASIDEGNIAFYAFTQSSELGGGVYIWRDGTVHLVADINTPVPGGVNTFNAIEDPIGSGPFSNPPMNGTSIAFRASADNPRQRGIYTCIDGQLQVVANLDTAIPQGSGRFTFLSGEITLDNDRVAFRGEGQDMQRGIYSNMTGPISKIVDKNDPIPEGTGLFTSVGYPWFDHERILFTGDGAEGQQGIYVWENGALDYIADRNTPIPMGAGSFVDFIFNWSPPSISRGNVAFRALGANDQEGLYLYMKSGDALLKVIDNNDTLQGKRIKTFTMGSECLSGSALIFLVRFTDDSYGIYMAVAPFRRGDANSDGGIDLADAIFLLQFLFSEKSHPACDDAADANDDGVLNMADPIRILDYLFNDVPQLAPPFLQCGGDPTPDTLACTLGVSCQ